MKTHEFYCGSLLTTFFVLLALSGGTAAHSATLTLSPSSVSNTYSGLITVQIGGLTNGETVSVEYSADINGNGVWDQSDWLQQYVRITDGQWPTLGGVPNINMPGDTTGVDGAITSILAMLEPRSDTFVGTHFVRVMSPTDRFEPVTATFVITNTAFAQSISGNVTSSGTNVPGAIIVVLAPDPSGGGGELVTGTVADETGHYLLRLPVGSYQLLAARPGYVFNMGAAAPLTLGVNDSLVENPELVPATQLLSGRVVDATNTATGLPAVFMPIESVSGLLAVASTDPDGYFSVPVVPDTWRVSPDMLSLKLLGYVEPQNRPQFNTTTGAVSSAVIALPKGNAMFWGFVNGPGSSPLTGIRFYAHDDASTYESSGVSAPDGRYCAVVLAGASQISLDNQNPQLKDSVMAGGLNGVTLTNSQALRADFTVATATASISGTVKGADGTPVAGLSVYAYCTSGAGYNSGGTTDTNGHYSIPAVNGTWNVGMSCNDDGGLKSKGYNCVPYEHSVLIPPTNAILNMTVFPLGTGSLRDPVRFGGSQFGFWLDGAGGYTYLIETSTNAASTNGWTPILTPTLMGDSMFIQDNQTGDRQRFYRVRPGL